MTPGTVFKKKWELQTFEIPSDINYYKSKKFGGFLLQDGMDIIQDFLIS